MTCHQAGRRRNTEHGVRYGSVNFAISEIIPGKQAVGVRDGIRTHGPRIHPTSVFTAPPGFAPFKRGRVFVVWTVPLP